MMKRSSPGSTAARSSAARDWRPGTLQFGIRVDVRGANRRGQSKQQSRRNRHGRNEAEHGQVRVHIECERPGPIPGEAHQQSAAPSRKEQPQRGACRSQDQALGEQLSDEADASCSDR